MVFSQWEPRHTRRQASILLLKLSAQLKRMLRQIMFFLLLLYELIRFMAFVLCRFYSTQQLSTGLVAQGHECEPHAAVIIWRVSCNCGY